MEFLKTKYLRKTIPWTLNLKRKRFYMFSFLLFLFRFLCHIPVILSIPNKDVLHINNISIISGEGVTVIVQYIHINKHVIHPKNPHTRLLLNPECAVNIFIKNLFIIYDFI